MDAAKPSYFACLLALLPGLGHLWIGRARRGLVHFVAVTGLMNLALLSTLVPDAPLAGWGLRLMLLLAIGIWIHALLDLARLAVLTRLPAARKRRSRLFHEGFDRFVRGDYTRARARFEAMLEKDGADPLARLYLCALERRSGNPHTAVTHAGRALACFPRNSLHRELKRELRAAKEALRGR